MENNLFFTIESRFQIDSNSHIFWYDSALDITLRSSRAGSAVQCPLGTTQHKASKINTMYVRTKTDNFDFDICSELSIKNCEEFMFARP